MKRSGPNLHVFADAASAEAFVADLVADTIRQQPRSVLGFATGNSMKGVYRRLVALHRGDGLSFNAMTSFNLDEYCGLDPSDPASFAAFMRRHLFDMVDADPARLYLPDGIAFNAARDYEALIAAANGIDLQLLGIGRNGHIGFNEPGSSPRSQTRIVELAPRTREVNAADFPPSARVPSHAITMGIATILASRRIVLLATGAAKAEALADALQSSEGPHNPASYLQSHPDVTLVCDAAAAAHLHENGLKEKRHA